MTRFGRRAAAALVLCALAISAYLPALSGEFIWDDQEYVRDNALVKAPGGLWRIWTDPKASPQYYPLVFTSFWTEHRLWKLDVRGYHAVNILLHTAGALLLWRILAALLAPGAWLAAALFALHPVNVESVAWITERKNTLSVVFFLGAVAAYLHFSLPGTDAGERGAAQASRRRPEFYGLALVLFLFALLSKTTAAVMPGVVLILLWWKKKRLTAGDLLPLAPLAALGAGAGLFTAWLEVSHVGAGGADWESSPLEKLVNAGRISCFYLKQLLWPADLSFIYPRWDIHAPPWWTWVCAGGLAGGIAALWLARGRIGKGHLAAAACFLLCLFPALGFFKVYPMRFSFVADHFQYLAGIAPLSWCAAMLSGAAFGAAGGNGLTRGRGWAGASRAAAAAIVAVLWGLTWRQCHLYRSPEDLWRGTVRLNPNSWVARSNLADTLLLKGSLREGLENARAAAALKPGEHSVQIELGKALVMNGRPAEAIPPLQEALRLVPNHGRARFWLAQARMLLGQGAALPPGHGR